MAQDFGDDMGNALLNFVTRQTENYLRFGRGRERAFDWWQRHYKKEGNTPEAAKAMAEKQSSREQVVVPFGTSEEAAYYAQVCRENGTYAAFYKENEDTGEKELAGRYPKLVGYWNVFNAEDIEGIPPENAPVHLNDRTATIAQNLEESSRCPVIESSGYLGSAAYSPATDRILIAPRETFRSDEAFTRVLLHEMTHSTGHPSALARDLDTRFGSPSYAEEELVAELGSLFLSADLGIQSTDLEGKFYENHVSYLQSWMNALENDPSYLFKAASKADHADTFIMERYEEELGKNIEIDAPELEEEVSLAGESHDMASASEHQPESEMPENVLSTVL